MKQFNPLFYYLAAANFLFFIGNSLFILFPIFLKNLGASESYIGFMNNIDKIFVIITAICIGSLMHGRDQVRLLRLGYAVSIAAFLSYLLISKLSWLILIIRIAHGIGFSIAMILGTTIIFSSVSMEDATEAIGLYGITGALSNAISPLFGEMLLAHGFPHSFIFALSGVFATLSFAITFFIPRQKMDADHVQKHPLGSSLVLLKDLKFLLVSMATFIFGGLFGVIITFLPNFVRATTDYKFSWFFVTYILVLIIIRFTLVRAVNRLNRNILIMIMFFTGTLTNLFMNLLYLFPVFILVSALYGITHGVLYPVLNTITVSIVAENERGRSNALFTAFFNSGMMVFSFVLGHLIDHTGTYLAAFNVSAASSVVAIAIVIIITVRYGTITIPMETPVSVDEFEV